MKRFMIAPVAEGNQKQEDLVKQLFLEAAECSNLRKTHYGLTNNCPSYTKELWDANEDDATNSRREFQIERSYSVKN